MLLCGVFCGAVCFKFCPFFFLFFFFFCFFFVVVVVLLFFVVVFCFVFCFLFFFCCCFLFCFVFFSPLSNAITSLGEEMANLSAIRTFVRFTLVWFCRFPLPLGVWEGLQFVIVVLPGLFSYLFWSTGLKQGERIRFQGRQLCRIKK